jgi:hypothetical protein
VASSLPGGAWVGALAWDYPFSEKIESFLVFHNPLMNLLKSKESSRKRQK